MASEEVRVFSTICSQTQQRQVKSFCKERTVQMKVLAIKIPKVSISKLQLNY